jgi:hypothetical protein
VLERLIQNSDIERLLVYGSIGNWIFLHASKPSSTRSRSSTQCASQRSASRISTSEEGEGVRILDYSDLHFNLLISVAASVLAIWQFANTDTLWRTVATCIVVAGGTAAFALVNAAFGLER